MTESNFIPEDKYPLVGENINDENKKLRDDENFKKIFHEIDWESVGEDVLREFAEVLKKEEERRGKKF